MSHHQAVEKYRREFVKYFFKNYSYQYIRTVGDGNNGGTALFATPGEGKVVVKFANRPETDKMIENEKGWLGHFKGLEHFIQRVDLEDVEGAERPTRRFMAVEYLSNRDLAHLAARAVEVAPFPNRVLWSFFLCLVRVAAGMARWSSPDKKTGRETLSGPRQVSNIVHNSYKPLNICVGDLIPNDWEHRLAPVLKMIDFGRTAQHSRTDHLWLPLDADPFLVLGLYQNIFDAAWTIQGLVGGENSPWSARHEAMTIRTAKGRFRSHVRPGFWEAQHVDQELRHLVGECLAEDVRDVPRPGALLAHVESAVKVRDRNNVYDVRIQPMEDDALIAEFWRRVLFEPPDTPAVPLGHLAEAVGLAKS